jgi:hypothetical protein
MSAACLPVSVRMEQAGSHWNDFHEIGYFIFFSKILQK